MKNTNTKVHATTEALLRKLGFSPFRQFEPVKADMIGKGELFEVWKKDSSGKLLFVHFYGNEAGVEFYAATNCGNTWAQTEAALSAL